MCVCEMEGESADRSLLRVGRGVEAGRTPCTTKTDRGTVDYSLPLSLADVDVELVRSIGREYVHSTIQQQRKK